MRTRRHSVVEVLRIEDEDLDADYSPELRAISVRPLPALEARRAERQPPRAVVPLPAAGGVSAVNEPEADSVEPDPAAAVWQSDRQDSAGDQRSGGRALDVARLGRWAVAAFAALGVVVASAVGDDSRSATPKSHAPAVRTSQAPVAAAPQVARPRRPRPSPVGERPRRRRERQRKPARRVVRANGPSAAAPTARPARAVLRPSAPRAASATPESEFGIEVAP